MSLLATARHDFGQFFSEFLPEDAIENAIDTVVQILHTNYKNTAKRIH